MQTSQTPPNGPRYKRIAVIGTGPSGYSATRALSQEGVFNCIRVFERRESVGGTWLYDSKSDIFQPPNSDHNPKQNRDRKIPPNLHNNPQLTDPEPEDPTVYNPTYDTLDTNAGASTMAFTHTPIPWANSLQSIKKYGRGNSSRPWKSVLAYIEDLFIPYLHLVTFRTTVEKIEKVGTEWVLTLRQERAMYRQHGDAKERRRDYWWQERFDAVVVATGHFSVANVPNIEGLEETAKAFPEKFEHSKAWRTADKYIDKYQTVVVVGGAVSAADLVDDLHAFVKKPLYLSQRTPNPFLAKAWYLPDVERKPDIKGFSPENSGTIHYTDGTKLQGFDHVIFATGYKLSYPFMPFEAITPQNRMNGFYQHIFRIGDPSLTVVGQVKVAVSFRVYEYQAVTVARYFAGRSQELPSIEQQSEWEANRILYKGPTEVFHEIRPDFAEYYGWMTDFHGDPAKGADTYKLPVWEESWIDSDIEILLAKDRYWGSIGAVVPPPIEGAKV